MRELGPGLGGAPMGRRGGGRGSGEVVLHSIFVGQLPRLWVVQSSQISEYR